MRFEELTADLKDAEVSGPDGPDIAALCYDSREAVAGTMFFALRGSLVDGHKFIDGAIEKGTSAVVAETVPGDISLPWVKVGDSRRAMSQVAATFHGDPSGQMKVAGITGTNGKTTTAFLLHYLLKSAWHRAGLLGTVHNDLGDGEPAESSLTTPESPELQGLLAQMVDRGCRAAVMEVSSHALEQRRAADVLFDTAIFSNLSRDHLDYHGTMEDYFQAKCILFEQMANQTSKDKPVAVVNGDDEWGRRIAREFGERLKVITYGLGVKNDFRAIDVRFDSKGTRFQLDARGRSSLVRLPLIGRFNVYNAVAAIAAGSALGINLRESIANMANCPQVPGRLEKVGDRQAFRVFVDYAHTPDALENAIKTVRELDPRQLITVFGCGGNRDIEKRKEMGKIASQFSDFSIITSDNPRNEDPLAIIENIKEGMGAENFAVEEDRRAAILAAFEQARPGDIVLIAGKGHEGTQTFADETIEFDDRVVARQCLSDLAVGKKEGGRA